MKTLLVFLFLFLTPLLCAWEVKLVWEQPGDITKVLAFEVETRSIYAFFVYSEWAPAGTAFVEEFTMSNILNGRYQARVRAIGVDGLRSNYSNICDFRFPKANPLRLEGVRLDVVVPNGTIFSSVTLPVTSRAVFKLEEHTPQILVSNDLFLWGRVGPTGPIGNYELKTRLVYSSK